MSLLVSFSIPWKSFTFCFSYPLWRLAPLYYPLFPYYCHIRSPSLNVPSLKFPFLRCNSQKNVLRTLYSCLFHRLGVMALSFSPRVAVWRAREPHKSDASVTHNRSLKKKKKCFALCFLISFFILHSCPGLPPVSVFSFTITARALIAAVLSELRCVCVCSHQSGSWIELSLKCCWGRPLTHWWYVRISDAGPRDSKDDQRIENV